jgi:drug/metabolite transporter (DMT)-like permease
LVGNIGADRAAYATLLFPLVALAISTVWEGYKWTGSALFGVCLILCGNLLMIQRKKLQQSTNQDNHLLRPWPKKSPHHQTAKSSNSAI